MNNKDITSNRKTSFSELALALANDYDSIYVIDYTDDSYVEYTAVGGEKELVLKSQGDDFFEELKSNCRLLVWPADQPYFLRELKKSRVLEKLENGKSFSLRYRLNIDGKPQYYFLKTIRASSEDIVIGVQNVNEEMQLGLKEKENSRIYSEIAKSLAGMFEAIYYIDINTGSYTEYYSSETFSDLGIDVSGENFFEKVNKDIQVHIYEDDRGMLIRELDRDRLLHNLEREDTYSIIYRQLIDGRIQYLNILAFRQENDDNHIVIAVRNIDEQKRQEDDAEVYSHIAGSLASRYEVIYYIDIDTNNYTQYRANDIYAQLGTSKTGDDFFSDIAGGIKNFIHKDDVERALTILEKNHLLSILAKEGTLTFTGRMLYGEEYKYVSILVVRPKNDENHLVIGLTNIDAQIKREEAIKEESLIFDEVAIAIAEQYEVIYQVNTKTNAYMEYRSSERYSRLKIDTKGRDFFEETQKNLRTQVFADDYPMMAVAMQKDFFLETLNQTGKFIINYRLLLDGRPQYVTLFAVRPKEDNDHIVIAVANIDATRRRELQFEDALDGALDMGNYDTLTGLKNRRGFAQKEMIMDDAIAKKEKISFSILVADINGLKIVNDTEGKEAGDALVQRVSRILSESFKGCKLYRTGGDKFLVLFEGDTYSRREEMIRFFDELQESNREKNLPTVAYGVSDYNSLLDHMVQDVYERADNAMKHNKLLYHDGEERDTILRLKEYENDARFYTLFEQLIDTMSHMEGPDIPRIEKLLIEISAMHRLSMAITRVYKSALEEQQNSGETLCCYDTGIEGEEIISLRTENKVGTIATMKAYMSPNEKPLSDREKERVTLVMRSTLNYIVRNRLRDRVEELTYYDADGFKNMRYIQRYFAQNKEYMFDKVAFRYNLKHFSLVNNEHGKEVGDIVMSRHFQQLERIIGDKGGLCRLGGDNFAGICAKGQISQILSYLTETKVEYDEKSNKVVSISTTVGVYKIPYDGEVKSVGDIMEKVNIAYHAAQTGGKDSIVFYTGKLIEDRESAMKVQQLFPEALRNEEFRVYYQPKVDIRTGELIGAEALCRWFHNDEMISPGAFIPVLEETNDICKLDFYMLDHACKDINRWIDEGRKSIRVSVNLSRKHLSNPSLVDNLLKIIDKHNVPHSCIEIELTETNAEVGFGELKRVVTGLQNVGIFTSVDDFGVGYSSLNLIRELPWNVIKVDKSFLPEGDEEMDDVSKIMFKHVIQMTTEMGIECIVEGVETEKQLAILRENNCIYAQGFYYDRPLPKEEFEDRLIKGVYGK